MKVSSNSQKESPFRTDISRQAKAKRKDKRRMYVTIVPKKIQPFSVNKMVTLLELSNGYDIFDGTMHHKGETVSDMFLDFMSLIEEWQNILVISYDAWHHSEIVMDVILKSNSLRPNQPKVEPNYFELKAYTKEKKENRKAITVVSTANYLGAKEDEFGFSYQDELLEDTARLTTEKMHSFFKQKMEEFGHCFGLSTAKIAWNKWIKEYLPFTITMPKVINKEIQNHIRGARIQAYELGHRSYGEQVDFNSLYGYVAENNLVSVEPIVHPLVSGILPPSIEKNDGEMLNRPIMPNPLLPKDVETMVKMVEQGQQPRKEIEGDAREIIKNLPDEEYMIALKLVHRLGSYKKALEAYLSPNSQVNYHFFISWEYQNLPSRISVENHGSEGLTEYYRGQGRVTGIELKRMYEEGTKIWIHSFSAFRSEKIFGTFATNFNRKRLESKDKLNRVFYKMLIVGLIGRTAMKLPQRQSKTSGEMNTKELGKIRVEDLLQAESSANGRIPISLTVKNKSNSLATIHNDFVDITTNTKRRANIPIVFEEITAYGRDLMYGLMEIVDAKFGEGTTAYTHTDSLLFNKKGVVNFLESLGWIGKDIGQLKFEHRGAYEIYGINDFVIHDVDRKNDHWVHGGISSEAIIQGDDITNVRKKTARSPELLPKSKKLSELRNNKNHRKLKFIKENDTVKRGYPLDSMRISERRIAIPHPSGKKKMVLILPDYLETMNSRMDSSFEIGRFAKKKSK